jgi:uncharacterized protein YndB with AHSA1/START domain
MSTHTIHVHRVLRASPEKVYRAFTDADAMCRWLPPFGFLGKVHLFEPKVGGRFRMSFVDFRSGAAHTFGGEFLELVPPERLRYTDQFEDPNLPGILMVTVALRAVLCGTELTIEQSGVPEHIPAEMCHLGWQESLVQLAQLVEADIPA